MDDNQHNDNQQQEHHEGQQDQNQDRGQQGQQQGQAAKPKVNQQLADAKRRATQALTPLLGELDVDAETKFNICISTIRSTDDVALIPVALDAALAIEDKSVKAQALVDLIGEINYQQRPSEA